MRNFFHSDCSMSARVDFKALGLSERRFELVLGSGCILQPQSGKVQTPKNISHSKCTQGNFAFWVTRISHTRTRTRTHSLTHVHSQTRTLDLAHSNVHNDDITNIGRRNMPHATCHKTEYNQTATHAMNNTQQTLFKHHSVFSFSRIYRKQPPFSQKRTLLPGYTSGLVQTEAHSGCDGNYDDFSISYE